MNDEKIVKEVRMELDHIFNQAKIIASSTEHSLALTNIQRGSMWLGQVLATLGATNPYPQSSDPNSPVIEERADQAKDSPAVFEKMPYETRTQSVKWLRLQLQNIIDRLKLKVQYSHEITVAIDALVESKMWFGQELNNIRLKDEALNN